MAYFSQNTINTLKDMYAFMREVPEGEREERGNARISCTMSFATSMRSAMSALRKQDQAWYMVKLELAALPEEDCYWDETVKGKVCMAVTMVKAEGKTTGANAKALRDAGMLRQSAGGGRMTGMPLLRDKEVEEMWKNAPPMLSPGQSVALYVHMGKLESEAKEICVLAGLDGNKYTNKPKTEKEMREIVEKSWAENYADGEIYNHPDVLKALEYWNERGEEPEAMKLLKKGA